MSTKKHEFFLGGHDLEMLTIRQLLVDQMQVIHDAGLRWGAACSAYMNELEACFSAGKTAVLIELKDDMKLELASVNSRHRIIDHHGDLAGADAPTSLEQVFQLLDLPATEWNRNFALVSANDRGHIPAMLRLDPPATIEELISVRAADRRAQGITESEEELGREAALNRQQVLDGQLTVVHLPHDRTATVTDALDQHLGGTGYKNLLVICPNNTAFFGNGKFIAALKSKIEGGWWGGELPHRGFWGCAKSLDANTVINFLSETE